MRAANQRQQQNPSSINGQREHEFRVVDGRMQTVGLPLPIELAALQAHHSIKPHTPQARRTHLQSIVTAGRISLRSE